MSWFVQLLQRFLFGDQTTPEQIREPVLTHLRKNGVSSPQLMATDLRAEVSTVDTACLLLLREGKIRRSEKQIVKPDPDEGIPSPYVRYELSPAAA